MRNTLASRSTCAINIHPSLLKGMKPSAMADRLFLLSNHCDKCSQVLSRWHSWRCRQVCQAAQVVVGRLTHGFPSSPSAVAGPYLNIEPVLQGRNIAREREGQFHCCLSRSPTTTPRFLFIWPSLGLWRVFLAALYGVMSSTGWAHFLGGDTQYMYVK